MSKVDVVETLILGIALMLLCAGVYFISASRVFPPGYRLPMHRRNRKRNRKR